MCTCTCHDLGACVCVRGFDDIVAGDLGSYSPEDSAQWMVPNQLRGKFVTI